MIVLIVIIFWLLRRYKQSGVVGHGMSKSDEEACRENMQNMRIAAMAAMKNKHQIYNNTRDCTNHASKVFETKFDDCQQPKVNPNKNINATTKECNLQPKIYKVVSLEQFDLQQQQQQPKSIDNQNHQKSIDFCKPNMEPDGPGPYQKIHGATGGGDQVISIGQLAGHHLRTDTLHMYTQMRPLSTTIVENLPTSTLHRHSTTMAGKDVDNLV